jgi:hypothetical protein
MSIFKGKIREMVLAMDRMRDMGTAGRLPRDVTLRQHIAENYKDSNGPLTPAHLFEELKINPYVTPVKELMADEDTKWLVYEFARAGVRRGMGLEARDELASLRKAIRSFAITGEQGGGKAWISPQVFTDPVMRGAIQSAFYNELIIREISVNNTKVTMPRLEISDSALVDSEEAATIEEGTVTYGDKDVKITKLGKGIKVTDEAVMFNSIDFVALYFEQLGRKFAAKLNGKAVTCLVNGDQADLSENAAVIGVADTVEGMTYRDVLNIWVHLGLIGRMANTLVGNVEMSVDYLDLPPVKNRNQIGTALLPTNLRTPVPSSADLFPAPQVADDQIIVVDPSVTMVQLTAQALKGESERFASKGLTGTYFTVYTGFAIVQRDGRVVLDRTLDIAAHDFPSWFDANEGD